MPKKKSQTVKRKNTSNKIGAKFEDRIQKVLDQLKKDGIACMSKVPTEFKIIRGAGGRIVNCFPVKESKFCDFTGVIKDVGHCDLEAKTTQIKTSFPLSNIQQSELDYMHYMYHVMGEQHLYYIIEFRALNEVYLIESIKVEEFISKNTRKSLPIDWIRNNGRLLDSSLDFIKYVK